MPLPAVKNHRTDEHLSTLTEKQARFVVLFVTNGFNATQAAIEAGYSGKDDNQMAIVGHGNIRKPKVMDAIRAEMQLRCQNLGWNKDRYVLVLQDILQKAIDDKAWPSALAALKEMGTVFNIVEEVGDNVVQIQLFSGDAAVDDPASRAKMVEHSG